MSAMGISDFEFLEDLQNCYSGGYHDTQKNEIIELIEDLDPIQLKNLYNYIRNTHTYRTLPDRPHIFKSMKVLGYFKKVIPVSSAQLHEQAPYQQVLKWKHKSAEWLADMCSKIQKLSKEELNSDRMSFNYYWNYLLSVPAERREEMKELIINLQYDEIYNMLDKYGKKNENTTSVLSNNSDTFNL